MKKSKVDPTLDGFSRGKSDEEKLNSLFRDVFESESGKKCLEYLKSVTVNAVLSPMQVEPYVLTHMEGQRYLVHLIDKRVEQGWRDKNGK